MPKVSATLTPTCRQALTFPCRPTGTPDRILVANVRWLAGYRHPRHLVEPVATELRKVFTEPRPLMDCAVSAGDPIAVLPVMFHLLWRHELAADLSLPLHAGSVYESWLERNHVMLPDFSWGLAGSSRRPRRPATGWGGSSGRWGHRTRSWCGKSVAGQPIRAVQEEPKTDGARTTTHR
jgi:hypothetical protein